MINPANGETTIFFNERNENSERIRKMDRVGGKESEREREKEIETKMLDVVSHSVVHVCKTHKDPKKAA